MAKQLELDEEVVDDAFDDAEDNEIFVTDDGDLIKFENVLQPHLARPENCALKERCHCKGEEVCLVEKALIVEATRDFVDQGGSIQDRLTWSRILNSLLMEYRLQKLGTEINYAQVVSDPEHLKLVEKYVNMTTKVQRSLRSDMKEVLMTRKEREKMRQDKQNTAVEKVLTVLDSLAKNKQAQKNIEEELTDGSDISE